MKLCLLILALLFFTIPVTADARMGVSALAVSGNSKGVSALLTSPQINRDAQVTPGPEAAPKQFLLLLLGESVVGALFFLRRKFPVHVVSNNQFRETDSD